MQIDALILADSVSSTSNQRLITMLIRIPRIMLAELTRHRNFSFSVESSRAKSSSRIFEDLDSVTMFYPFQTKNRKGMSGEEVDHDLQNQADEIYIKSFENVKQSAMELNKLGLHKQNVNRLLEPYEYIDVIITGTESSYQEFFKLRCNIENVIKGELEDNDEQYQPDCNFPAQPEIQFLAIHMQNALKDSDPQTLQPGEVHNPYGSKNYDMDEMLYAAAKCATISYDNLEKTSGKEAMINLAKRLVSDSHQSPFEHIAICPTEQELENNLGVQQKSNVLQRGKYFSNLSGQIQLRKIIENGEQNY